MIKKNRLGLLVLAIATTLTITGCSQDAYSGFFSFMGGNVYSDNLGLVLPGESSSGAEAATNQATTTTNTEVPISSEDASGINDLALLENGKEVVSGVEVIKEKIVEVTLPETFGETDSESTIQVVAVSGKITEGTDGVQNVKELISNIPTDEQKVISIVKKGENGDHSLEIPMFKPSTKEEEDEFVAQYGTSNETSKDGLRTLLEGKETDPIRILAAHNTIVAIGNHVDSLARSVESITFNGDTEKSAEIVSRFTSLATALKVMKLSESPSTGEVLFVKKINDVSTNLSKAMNSIITDADGTPLSEVDMIEALKDEDNLKYLTKAISAAEGVIAVANLHSDNSKLIDGIDFGSLLSAISNVDKAAKAGSRAEVDENLEVINSIIEGNRSKLRLLLSSYIGIEKVNGVYVYNETLNDSNIESNETISKMFETYFSVSNLAGTDESVLLREGLDSETFTGLNGLINYSLSFLLDNIDSSLDLLTTAYNTKLGLSDDNKYTVKTLIDTYLVNHTEILDAIYGTGDINVSLFYEKDGQKDPIIQAFMDGSTELNLMDLIDDLFTVTDGHIIEVENFFDNCIQIDLNTDGGLGVISELLVDGRNSLDDLDI